MSAQSRSSGLSEGPMMTSLMIKRYDRVIIPWIPLLSLRTRTYREGRRKKKKKSNEEDNKKAFELKWSACIFGFSCVFVCGQQELLRGSRVGGGWSMIKRDAEEKKKKSETIMTVLDYISWQSRSIYKAIVCLIEFI